MQQHDVDAEHEWRVWKPLAAKRVVRAIRNKKLEYGQQQQQQQQEEEQHEEEHEEEQEQEQAEEQAEEKIDKEKQSRRKHRTTCSPVGRLRTRFNDTTKRIVNDSSDESDAPSYLLSSSASSCISSASYPDEVASDTEGFQDHRSAESFSNTRDDGFETKRAATPVADGVKPKIVIIMEDSERAMPLIAHLVLLRADVTVWDAAGIVIDTEGPAPDTNTLYFCRTSPSSRTRGRGWAPAASQRLVEWLEHRGATVLNGSKALAVEVCKWRQVELLKQVGLETPRTLLMSCASSSAVGMTKALLLEKAQIRAVKPREAVMDPWEAWWVKPAHGGSGTGAARFEELAAVDRMVLKEPENAQQVFKHVPDHLWILQKEGNRPTRGAKVGGRLKFTRTFYRAEFLDRRLLYVLKVTAVNTSVSACPCDKRTNGDVVYEIVHMGTTKAWSSFQSKCIAYMSKLNMVVAAFEFSMPIAGKYLIFDVNSNTNYGAQHEKAAGVECGYLSLAKVLVDRARQMLPTSQITL